MSTEPFVPLVDPATAASIFTCPLCGARFTHGGLACGGCPLARSCELVQCPHCLYTFPRGSRLAAFFRRFLAGKAEQP